LERVAKCGAAEEKPLRKADSIMGRLLPVLLFSLVWSTALSAALPEAIERFFSKDKLDRSRLSLLVTEIGTGKEVASWRADEIRTPASVIKLMTTYAALLEFGPEWRWPTRFYYTGVFEKGTIRGDLVVKAYGDPTLSEKDLPSIVKRLKKVGVRRIEGDLLVDRSFFSAGGKISSGFDRHPYSEYNAMPDALMFDDHLCRIEIDTRSGRAEVHKQVPDSGYRVLNRLRVTSRPCRGRYSWPGIRITHESGIPTVVLSGTLSRRCTPRVIKRVLDHPYSGFYGALKREMRRQGMELTGKLRLGTLPREARALMTHRSVPLKKILAKTNKKSNNLYARHLFLLLGARVYGEPGSRSKGSRAVRKILEERGILGSETVLDNGCGLSRRSRTTARTLQKLLHHAYRHYGWKWMETLSIAGVDGTIRRRFRNTPVRRRAWMKTGTLKRAKNIAGYVRARSGRLYSVVILYNGQKRWQGALFQNQVLEWIVKNL